MSSYSEEFDRPDSSSLGPLWVEGSAGYSIVSGAAQPESTFTCFARRVSIPSTGDQRCTMRQGNVAGGLFVGIGVRFPNFTAGQGLSAIGAGYLFLLSGSTGTALSIRRKENLSTTITSLATGTAPSDVRADDTKRWIDVWDSAPGVVELRGYVLYLGDTDPTLVVSYQDSSGSAVPDTQTATVMWGGGTGGTTQRFAQVLGTDITPPVADTTPPTIPGSVAAIATSDTSVTISWHASTDASGVESYRIKRNGSNLIGATALTALTFNDTTVSAGSYSYTVSAIDTVGNRSDESSAAPVTITPVDTTPPPVPTMNTPTAGVQQAAFSWSAVSASDLVGYKLYVGTTNPPTTLVRTQPGTSYTRTGLTAGTTYYAAVASYDQAGNTSAKSTAVSVVPTAPVGGGITGVSYWTGSVDVPVTSIDWYDGSTTIPVVSIDG